MVLGEPPKPSSIPVAGALARPTRDTMALLPSIEESVQQRNWLCGTAVDAVALLKELEERYPGVERVIVSFAMGTPKAVYLEQLARFAEEVMPAFCCPAASPSGSGQSVG